MARVLPVPIDVWNQLFNMRRRGAWLGSDADNEGMRSESILAARREQAVAQAEEIGADVWEFVMGSGHGAIRYFFIAKDEKELRSKVIVAQIMAI